MYCKKCGKHNEEGSNFCKSCGSKIIQADTVAKNMEEKAQKYNEASSDVGKEEANKPAKEKKSNSINWFFWWVVDNDELAKQVHHYKTLNMWSSSRKLSSLLLVLSSVVTILAVMFLKWDSAALLDVVLMLAIAIFVHRGYRWALIIAMIYWTFAKLYILYEGFSTDSSYSSNIIVSLIWWATYMHVFYTAYKVEKLRRKIPQAA